MINERDPVCGMTVDPAGPYRTEHGNRVCSFCSEHCLSRFRDDPERFAAGEHGRAEAGGRWTCPMHPQVVREEPGPCPLCGMALEATTPSAAAESPELVDMTRRFWVSLLLTIPVFAIAMSEMVAANPLTARFSPRAMS